MVNGVLKEKNKRRHCLLSFVNGLFHYFTKPFADFQAVICFKLSKPSSDIRVLFLYVARYPHTV